MRIKATVKNDNWFIYELGKVWKASEVPKSCTILGSPLAKGEFYLRADFDEGHFICIRDIDRMKAVHPYRNTNYRDDIKYNLFESYYPEELL